MEVEEQEYKRLKSREEKLMAYYEWYVDKENDLATVEDIVNKNIKLEQENRKLKAELEKEDKSKMNALNGMSDLSSFGLKQIKKLEQENEKMKEERDFFKEQATLWRKDYTNEYEKNRKLEDKLESLEK